jgi:8-oxo-dGTP pyrophosphatase MutT (NUDIX family)
MTLAPIRIAAAVISDRLGRILLVRKRDTRFFMQPGGKVDAAETPMMALIRELREELGCRVVTAAPWGVFSAPAANEPGRDVGTFDARPRASSCPVADGADSRQSLSCRPTLHPASTDGRLGTRADAANGLESAVYHSMEFAWQK